MSDSRRVTTKEQMARLWIHECQRVFGDRLTCEEDHQWLREVLRKKIEGEGEDPGFGMQWVIVVPNERLVFGDFMTADSDNRVYEEIDDVDRLKTVVEVSSSASLSLALFLSFSLSLSLSIS
jgi:dynein heavy chain